MNRIKRAHVLFAALAAAMCVPAAGVSSTSAVPTTIGKGEGSLNLIEWAAYSDPSFAKPFEKQTGCTIHRKDAGLLLVGRGRTDRAHRGRLAWALHRCGVL